MYVRVCAGLSATLPITWQARRTGLKNFILARSLPGQLCIKACSPPSRCGVVTCVCVCVFYKHRAGVELSVYGLCVCVCVCVCVCTMACIPTSPWMPLFSPPCVCVLTTVCGAGRAVLRRSTQRIHGDVLGAGALALFDQHLSFLEPRPAHEVSIHLYHYICHLFMYVCVHICSVSLCMCIFPSWSRTQPMRFLCLSITTLRSICL